MDELTVIPTGTALGAQVLGLDLRRPLDLAVQEQLHAAFTAHSVLLCRDQDLSQADQLRISRCFGEPIPHPTNTRDRDPDFPAITILSNIRENGRPVGALGNDEVHWHIDLVFLHMPGSVSLLYCLETPERGGDTWWASGYKAYEALDKPTQQKLDGVSALYRHRRPEYNPPEPAIHPLVCMHPVSRRKTLYLSPGSAQSVVGLDEAAGAILLQRLGDHLDQPCFSWRHSWRPGDLVIWDNRCTLHRRAGFDGQARRLMWRTQMVGPPSG